MMKDEDAGFVESKRGNKADQSADPGLNNNLETEIMDKLSAQCNKDFNQLSLSEKEKVLFNYLHQSLAQEEVKGVTIEDILHKESETEDNPKNELVVVQRDELKGVMHHIKHIMDSVSDKSKENLEENTTNSRNSNVKANISDASQEIMVEGDLKRKNSSHSIKGSNLGTEQIDILEPHI